VVSKRTSNVLMLATSIARGDLVNKLHCWLNASFRCKFEAERNDSIVVFISEHGALLQRLQDVDSVELNWGQSRRGKGVLKGRCRKSALPYNVDWCGQWKRNRCEDLATFG
jgi:hypothetical protein